MLLDRHENLAAEVSALLLARELVFPVDAGGPRRDQRLRQFVGVERTAEAGLGIRDDGREPVLRDLALGALDLVLPQQRVVDAADHGRHAVGGVEALVGVGLAREVAVGGDLPPAEVDGLQPRAHLLHGLTPGVGAEGPDVLLGVEEVPEVLGPAAGEGRLLPDAAAQADDVLGRVRALDAVPPRVDLPRGTDLIGGLGLVAGTQGLRGGGGLDRHVVLLRVTGRRCPVETTFGEEHPIRTRFLM